MLKQHQALSESISILSATDERWLSFLSRNTQANIFHHPAWSQLLADCYGFLPFVCAVYDADGEIMAGLPVIEINSWLTGQRWVSLPYTDHCSPLYENSAALDCLISGLINLTLERGTRKLELRKEFTCYPRLQLLSPYVLHTLALDPDFCKVNCRIHPMHRRNAKTALRRGVHVEIGKDAEHMKAFYRLHIETRRHKGMPVQPWRYFDTLREKIIDQGLGFVLLAYHDEKIIAGIVMLACCQTLTYKYGASYLDSLNLRPNDLLFQTAIQWGCEHGFKVLDFGRTDVANQGLRIFKSNWGADEIPLTYSFLTDKPPKPSSGRMEALMQRIIKRSPAWVCRSAGELLYGHFG